jgi:outer membrane protein TolC
MLSEAPVMPRRSLPVILGVVLAAAAAAPADPGPLAPATTVARRASDIGEETHPPSKEPLPKLNIGDCLRIAYEKQPKLCALRASLEAAQAGQRGVESARLIGHLSPQYKYRQQQAAEGITAATAEFDQACHDVAYSVAWTYYSVVYAREQLKVAKDAVEFVDFYREQVEKIVNDKKGGNREINQLTLNRLIARLAEGKRQLIRAHAGYEKAQSALREAMGVDPNYLFDPADQELPDFAKFELQKDVVVAHARTRRGEVVMAGIASEVTRLEAYAQWSLRFRYRSQTFASGADIHARPIPPGHRDGEYRPDAIGPEMPANMFGNRQTRTERAWALAARSQAVLEKTINLVTLEAENAFIDYHYAGLSMAEAKKQAEAGKANLAALKEVAGDKVSTAANLQSLLEAQGEAATGQAAYNDAVRQRIAALANIERITAGGVKINYPGR